MGNIVDFCVLADFKECFNLYAKTGFITSIAELSLIMRSLALAPTTDELPIYFKSKGDFAPKVHFRVIIRWLFVQAL